MASIVATMMRMKAKAKAQKRKEAMATAANGPLESKDDDEIQFSERVLPAKGFDLRGFFVYCVFLGFFLATSLVGRTSDTYRLAQFSRDLVGVEDSFMAIDNSMKYAEWLEYHFFYGLGNVSYRAHLNTNGTIVLAGPPRVRQIRAATTCEVSAEMDGFGQNPQGVMCWNKDEEENAWPEGDNTEFQFEYKTATELAEGQYSMHTGTDFTGSGYVLRNISKFLRRDATKVSQGNEYYTYAHSRPDCSDLLELGWLTPRTRAIFHDFTLYSATANAYVTTRLVIEIGSDHQLWIPAKHISVVYPHAWDNNLTFFSDVMFWLLLFSLVVQDLWVIWVAIRDSNVHLRELVVEKRFDLRLKMVQHAGFKGLFAYRPRILMSQISRRITASPANRAHHINQLNSIGRKIPELHETYTSYMQTNRGKSRVHDPQEQTLAILEILKMAEAMRNLQQQVDLVLGVDRLDKGPLNLGQQLCMRVRKIYIRIRVGLSIYFRGWAILDWVNYTLFAFAFAIRIFIVRGQIKIAVDGLVAHNTMDDPWGEESEFVHFYSIGYWIRVTMYANAFNASLTWIKLFKYLNYFPNMRIMTSTLKVAIRPLLSFSLVVMVVLTGSGQGFFLSFGLDVEEYRSFFLSIVALLRMAVGDFDYVQLENSHSVVGPAMFWIYIFLMFFILMSVFIALIAESYEKARSDLELEKGNAISRMPASDNPEKLLRNRKRVLYLLKTMREEKIASPAMLTLLDEQMLQLADEGKEHSAPSTGLNRVCSCFKRSATNMVTSFEGLAQSGESHSTLAHTVDVFTDDEDDQAMDEAADLIGDPNEVGEHFHRMKVSIIEATGLPKKDVINANDVYVLASVLDVTRRSETISEAGSNPIWQDGKGENMTFRTQGKPEPVGIKVMDRDDATDDDLIGSATFDIADHHFGPDGVNDTGDLSRPWCRDVWLGIITDKGKPGGKIHLVVEWDPPGSTAEGAVPSKAGASANAFKSMSTLVNKASSPTIFTPTSGASGASGASGQHLELMERLQSLESSFKSEQTSARQRLGEIFFQQQQVLHRLTQEL
jgi:hypothetical protein